MPKIGVVGIPHGWSSVKLLEAFRRHGEAELIDMSLVSVDLDSGAVRQGDVDLRAFDAMVIKKIGSPYSPDLLDRLALLHYLQGAGVPIFSRPMHIRRILDRLSCTVRLRMGNIPMPPTVITEDIASAVEAVERFGKVVLKPLYTSKARGMEVLEAGAQACERLEYYQSMGNRTLYVQKMANLPGKDLGLAFLGGEFIGCYARVGNGLSWNTTTHSGGKYAAHEPEPEVLDLARRAQALFELDFTSVDIAETDEGPIVFEVSAFGGFRGLWEGLRVDAADRYARYVLRRIGHG